MIATDTAASVGSAHVMVHVARDAAGRFVKTNQVGESTAPLR